MMEGASVHFAKASEGLLETPSCSQKVKGKHSRGSGCHCVGTLRAVHFHHNEERMLAIFSQGVLCSIAEATGDSIATLVLIPVPSGASAAATTPVML